MLRDPSGWCYIKEDAGKLLVGCFEPKAKPRSLDSIPEDFSFGQFPEDWDHFEPAMMNAIHRVPKLEEAGIQLFFNGPESFTPDDRYILGEAPELRNFYVAAGFNSIGIQSSGGAGKVLAEWIVNGHPPMDLSDVDIRRFHPFQVNERYLYERTGEALGLLYAMHWPFFNRKPAGVSDVPCFMTVSKMQAHVLGKWPDGNGPTGLPRKAWNHVTNTLTADRTGSKLLHQSTLLFGKMSDFLTCLHLENSWSRARTPKK